jgi:hypothetical protein
MSWPKSQTEGSLLNDPKTRSAQFICCNIHRPMSSEPALSASQLFLKCPLATPYSPLMNRRAEGKEGSFVAQALNKVSCRRSLQLSKKQF